MNAKNIVSIIEKVMKGDSFWAKNLPLDFCEVKCRAGLVWVGKSMNRIRKGV